MASQGNNGNKAAGTSAEEYIAEKIDGYRTGGKWYDIETPDGIHEVKSTVEELSSGRHGRFRLWEDQHRKYLEEGGTYHFLVDGVGYERLTAEEMDEVIEESGVSWTGSGSHRGDIRQIKIRWPEVFNRES
jgi:hypothetical protein